jgi:hypothetical protein
MLDSVTDVGIITKKVTRQFWKNYQVTFFFEFKILQKFLRFRPCWVVDILKL